MDPVQARATTTIKNKVNVSKMLSLKSCMNDENMRQEKWVKVNEDVTVFDGMNMLLKDY